MLSDLLIRVRSIFRRNAVENELDTELLFHFDQQVEKLISTGLSPQEARRRARLTIGASDHIKEECREARGTHLLENFVRDIRYALRMLRKNPGFAAAPPHPRPRNRRQHHDLQRCQRVSPPPSASNRS